MKKVLHIITKGAPMGGAQKYVFELATLLPADQFESIVACGAGDTLPQKLKEKGIRCIKLSFLERDVSFFKEWSVLWQLVALMRAEKPDIVHLNSSKIGGLGTLAARIARVPHIIFTAHGWAFNERRHDIHRTLMYAASWLTALLAHTVIAVSERDAAQGRAMPLVARKIHRIWNGVPDIDYLSKEEARGFIQEKIGVPIPSDSMVIGTIAELHPNKNLSALIDAAYRLTVANERKFSIFIIGEGEEREKLEAEIHEKYLDDIIFLVGSIDHAARYLKAFDMFVLVSKKEGLPYTLLEAGRAGLPCLATQVGGIPEIIHHKESGFLVRPQGKEIMLGLTYLFENPEEVKQFGERLETEVKNDFSLDRMLTETIKLYELRSRQ